MDVADLKVRTGATKRYNDGEEHEIKRLIMHPGFKIHEYIITDDIGLIELAKPIKFSNVQKAIPLAKPTDEPTPGKILTVSGFGREEQYEETKTLQLKAAYLPIASLEKCQDDYFLDPVTDKMICAGNSADSSCKGDSGGPGVMDHRLAAIVSTGFLCDTTNVPAVFTAVYKHLDWINQYVQA
ncbi:trypsin-7-like [Nasonia vitripennis]|uniref:Peptidase S1 domain-containing protein n=1 Tax=Nasonia vitripennis TaxID=7425 RepID=A0A7M7Q8H3_NASVI|nr:trypsin-7-like [Nasonia vitripennis]